MVFHKHTLIFHTWLTITQGGPLLILGFKDQGQIGTSNFLVSAQ